MKLDAKRLYYVLLGLIGVVLVVVLCGVYLVNGLLQSRAKEVRTARLHSMVQDEKQRQLGKALSDIHTYTSLAAIAKSIVPQDKDQAQTVREIVRIAGAHNIKLGTVTFPASSLGDNKTPHSQLKAVPNIAGVYSLDITIQSDGTAPAPFNDFILFLDALEHNRRTALVTGIAIQPDPANASRLGFTLTLNEYIKP